MAEHFLQQGDRVSLRVLSALTPLTVPTGTGKRHGVRILDTLSRVVPAVAPCGAPSRGSGYQVSRTVPEGVTVARPAADAETGAAVTYRTLPPP